MAAVTAGVIAAGSMAASAGASIKAGRDQAKQNKRANAQLQEGALRDFSFGSAGGDGPFGSFNAETGQINTQLGSRLQGQRDQTDAFGSMFGSRVGTNMTQGLQDTIGMAQGVAGQQTDPNSNLFAGLQQRAQGGLNLAGAGLGRAAGIQGQLDPFAQQAFGMSSDFMNQIGSGQDAQAQSLSLMRQLAAPEEARQFQGLQQNQFSTGRLGSSGGALQTEAFARGLGQADTSRQLASFQEGRNTQQNAFGLARGLAGIGQGALSTGDALMRNAFSNFQGMTGLSQNIDQQRFSQEGTAQQNMFGQLASIFNMQGSQLGQQQGMENNAFSNFLRSMSAGQGIDQIPLDRLGFAQDIEAQRQNAALGVGTQMAGINAGQGASTMAAAFSGLAGGAQNFGQMFQGIGQSAQPSFNMSTNAGGQITGANGLNINESAFGPNPFAGMGG